MAIPMAMPAPQTPQIALTRKIIVIAIHGLQFAGLAGVLRQMPTNAERVGYIARSFSANSIRLPTKGTAQRRVDSTRA